MGAVACTIAAVNFLPRARVLIRSFRALNPEVPIIALIVGAQAHQVTPRGQGVEVIRLEDLGVVGIPASMRGYDIKGLCAAMKPSLLRHLLDRGHGTVVFLDPDVLVTHSLLAVFDLVGRHAMTLTPHLRMPRADPMSRPLVRSIALAGVYNAGFIGVTDSKETRAFLDWWERRLRTHCIEAVGAGIHYDQRWLDLAIGFVEDLHLLRDPGCNAAYWNFEQHRWSVDAGKLRVDGQPLRFFHFSGFDPRDPLRMTRHGDWRVDRFGPLAGLFLRYAGLLDAAAMAIPTGSAGDAVSSTRTGRPS